MCSPAGAAGRWYLLARLDLGPAAGHETLHVRRQLGVHERLAQHFWRRIDRWVVADTLIHQRVSLEVRVGITDFVTDLGDDFRLQQVVDKRMGLFDVGSIARDRQHVEPGYRPLSESSRR